MLFVVVLGKHERSSRPGLLFLALTHFLSLGPLQYQHQKSPVVSIQEIRTCLIDSSLSMETLLFRCIKERTINRDEYIMYCICNVQMMMMISVQQTVHMTNVW